jgi:hypothetical protein
VLQARTSTNATSSSAGTWSAYSSYPGTVCEDDAAGSSIRQCANGTDSGATWTAWTPVASCTSDFTGSSRRECRRTAPYSSCAGTWSNSQCANVDTMTLPYCQSSVGAWADVGSCTAAAQDASGAEIECQTVVVNGSKLQFLPKAYVTTYSGPPRPLAMPPRRPCRPRPMWSAPVHPRPPRTVPAAPRSGPVKSIPRAQADWSPMLPARPMSPPAPTR